MKMKKFFFDAKDLMITIINEESKRIKQYSYKEFFSKEEDQSH